MRVLLDTTPLRFAPSGTAVYVERLAAALREEGIEVLPLANERRGAPGTGRTIRNLLSDLRFTQGDLRRAAADADVVHHPLPMLTLHCPRPQVVTVHDLAFAALPEDFDARFGAYARRVHRFAARRADAVVVPSTFTAAELERRWGVEGAIVAPHGPGQELDVVRGQVRHLLYVGDAEPRKDLPTLLDAYARYRQAVPAPLPLVLAGRATAEAPGVEVVTEPDRARLADLYGHAAALVHPSRYEGFGLTVLEALVAGVPVIAADIPAVREVAGQAPRYVPAGDAAALAAALADPPAPGKPVQRPDWRRSALAHISAYEAAVTAASRRRRAVGSPTS